MGGKLAYDYYQKKKGETGNGNVLETFGLKPQRSLPGPTVRGPSPKTVKMRGGLMTPAKIIESKVRTGLTPARITASKTRTVLTRPATLSECCESLCLPTLKRTTRENPPFEQRVSFNRNLWANYYNC